MKRTEIERLLPQVMQRTVTPGSPLAALLDVMVRLQTPAETVLERLDSYFDPYQAPDAFVPLLASWLDLDRFLTGTPTELTDETAAELFATSLGRLRELIQAAPFLSQWRGTAKGLICFLETATGVSGFVIDEQVRDETGQIRPFHIHILAPIAARPYDALIQRIIILEKPAYVTYRLEYVEY